MGVCLVTGGYCHYSGICVFGALHFFTTIVAYAGLRAKQCKYLLIANVLNNPSALQTVTVYRSLGGLRVTCQRWVSNYLDRHGMHNSSIDIPVAKVIVPYFP